MLDDTKPRAGSGATPASARRAADGPLRILMSSYRSNPLSGGQGVFMRHLTRALLDLGHAVDVVSGPPYPDLDPRVALHRLPSLDLYAAKRPSLEVARVRSLTDLYEWSAHMTGRFGEPYAFGRRFAEWIRPRAARYDVLHDNQPLSWGVLAARDAGLPTVGQLHHPITVDRDFAIAAAQGLHWRKWGLRQLIRRWHGFLPMQMAVARALDHHVSITEASRRDFADAFGLDPQTITPVHIGIDTDTFGLRPDVPRDAEHVVCTSSADVAMKGLVHLIEAIAILAPRRPELKLTVVGKLKPGPTQRRLDALDLGARVRFVSGVSDEELVRLYNRATLVAVPSLYEGFGLPAGEAMACGAPVVATTGGALPEVVGDAGLTVPPQDPEALAAAIETLLDDPNRRAALARAGRDRVLTKFSWRRTAEETVEVYRRAVAASC